MAEGKDYEAVLTEEDDQNKVPFEGAEEESKEATGRSPEENIELKGAHEGDDADDDDYDESHDAAFSRMVARKSFLNIAEKKPYEKVKEEVTARTLMNYGEDTLWLAIKVSEELRLRATRKKAYQDNFNALAEQVEEFTLRFVDPLKDLPSDDSQMAALKPELDLILETGTKLRVKKFFEHPVIDSILTERWHTSRGSTWKIDRPGLWLFLNIWCLVDVVLFPLSFSVALILGFKQLYEHYFTIPYFVFMRDTISYLALLALHFAICLESSQLPLSDLEWAILVFLFGRLLVEGKQIMDTARSKGVNFPIAYFYHFISDPWNVSDVNILGMYFFVILPLRIHTWTSSESPSNNQTLEVAGYLYGVNTMLLTFRVFGSFLEVFESVGTIQIALFQVMNDAVVVAVHFAVTTVAFSSAIAKVFRASPGIQHDTEKHSWLGIASQLSLSLLELSDGLDYFRSADSSSETFAHWLFALYLVMTLILLVNLLIALLSNIYQKVQDNSRREWTFKRAVRIQTYSNHDPVPVPFNIISMFLMLFPCFRKKKNEESGMAMGVKKVTFTDLQTGRQEYVIKGKRLGGLLSLYRQRYGNSFPVTETLHQMVKKTNNTVNQILEKAFTSDKALLPTGPKMCARDDVDHYQDLQLQEVKSELTEAKGELSEVKLQLNDVKVQLREATSKLEEKLDALLTKASEKQNE